MSEEMKRVFKNAEKNLSPERIAELNRAGETVCRFMNEHSSEEVNRYIESLPDQARVVFVTAGLWNCYKFFKIRKGVAA